MLDISKFCKCVPKIRITWCTAPEIWSERGKIFSHFGPFFPPNNPKNHYFEKKGKKCLEILSFYTYMCTKNEDHDIRFPKYKLQLTGISVILGHFLPFQPLTTGKIKILKLKKTPGNIIILHICTINDNHMIYGSRGMECNLQNFLSFWNIFCPFFYLAMDPENQILEKWKKHLTVISFYKCVPSRTVIWCMVPELWTVVHKTEFFVILDCFLPFTPLTNQKIKILKKWKHHLEMLSFYKGVP